MTEETEVQEPVAQAQEEQVQPQVEEKVQASQEAKRDPDHNWRQANEVMRLQKQQIDELKTQVENLAKPKQQPEPDEFANMDPDDVLTVSSARKLAERLAEKKAEEKARQVVQEYAQQMTIQSSEDKARSKYDDYDYVVETFAIPLIKNDPALAYKIQNSKNPAETAYKLGKLSDDYEESMSKQSTSPKAEKILKNSSRPLSGAAAGNPLKSQAEQVSKMKPDEIWAMSQKYARGA